MSSDTAKPCLIFAGCDKELIFPDEIAVLDHGPVICADRGLEFCHDAGLKADIAIGDFDSLDRSHLKMAEDDGTKIMEYPAEKDETDLELALKAAYRLGSRSCLVYGALGGRFDHELANVYLMKRFALMGMHMKLIGRSYSVELLNNERSVVIEGKTGATVSLIPMVDAVVGISTKGTKYELHGDDMVCGSSRGVSNVVTQDHAEISCVSGEAVVVVNNPSGAS